MATTKRGLDDGNAPSSKRRAPDPYEYERICDLPDALDCFSDPRAAAKAKASGLLRNWGAKDKYLAAEPLVLQAHASLEEDEELDEEALLEFAPQLSEFEAETLQTLIAQSRRHGDYELAARMLLVRQKDRLDAAHQRELRMLRAELDAKSSHDKASVELSAKQAESRAEETRRSLLKAAADKGGMLQAKIDEMEEELTRTEAEADEEVKVAVEREAELMRRCRELEEEVAACKDETDLKRETSRKLKEEVIDNDRLTLANLNRIKHLEAQLGEISAQLDEQVGETEAVQQELSISNQELAASRKQLAKLDETSRDEIEGLQELLVEREKLVQALGREGPREPSRHSQEVEARRDSFEVGRRESHEARRESLLERIGQGFGRSPTGPMGMF